MKKADKKGTEKKQDLKRKLHQLQEEKLLFERTEKICSVLKSGNVFVGFSFKDGFPDVLTCWEKFQAGLLVQKLLRSAGKTYPKSKEKQHL